MRKIQWLWMAAGLALALAAGGLTPALAQQSEEENDGSRQIKLSDGSRQIKVTNAERDTKREQRVGASFTTARAGTWKGSAGAKPTTPTTTTAVKRPVKPRRVYRHVAVLKRPPVKRTTPAPTVGTPRYEEVGVTVWRLRKARTEDAGPKLPDLNGHDWWTPERVEGTTPLNVGDRVRLSIESPRAGYLYVISTDQYSDGTTGKPRLIFPTTRTRGGDNRVAAGRLVDIPDQNDDTNFFTVTSDRTAEQSRQVAEVLTVIVAKEPITELSNTGRLAQVLETAQVSRWEQEWGGRVDLFELADGAGVAWTKEEQEASNAGGRSLTQEEPTPQTIYSVEAKPNKPILVRVQLLYGQASTAKN